MKAKVLKLMGGDEKNAIQVGQVVEVIKEESIGECVLVLTELSKKKWYYFFPEQLEALEK